MKKITIGLFGTCGKSTWRNDFINEYERKQIPYFNPQKDDWCPEDATIEADHLVNDSILLFPVTDETYAFGSLAETGFSILQALKLNERRDVIVMIAPDVKIDNINEMALTAMQIAGSQRKESCRARALVLAHLKKLNYSNVWVVDNLNDMFALSLKLYNIQYLTEEAKLLHTIKL